MDPVRVTTERGVMTVTLADVENRNALGAALLNGLHDALVAADADDAVRAVLITNEGSTFCAGANLKERSGAQGGATPSIGFDELLEQIQRSPKPVVGRIAGHVVGGGNGLASALDISIAAEAPLGPRVVRVTSPGGTSTATPAGANTFWVTDQPGTPIAALTAPLVGVEVGLPDRPPEAPCGSGIRRKRAGTRACGRRCGRCKLACAAYTPQKRRA